MKTEWISVNVDKRLHDKITKVAFYHGYKSVADFVADGIRRLLEHYHELALQEHDMKEEKL